MSVVAIALIVLAVLVVAVDTVFVTWAGSDADPFPLIYTVATRLGIAVALAMYWIKLYT